MHCVHSISVVCFLKGFLSQGSCSDPVKLLWSLPLWSYNFVEKCEYHYSESALHIGGFESFFLSG